MGSAVPDSTTPELPALGSAVLGSAVMGSAVPDLTVAGALVPGAPDVVLAFAGYDTGLPVLVAFMVAVEVALILLLLLIVPPPIIDPATVTSPSFVNIEDGGIFIMPETTVVELAAIFTVAEPCRSIVPLRRLLPEHIVSAPSVITIFPEVSKVKLGILRAP